MMDLWDQELSTNTPVLTNGRVNLSILDNKIIIDSIEKLEIHKDFAHLLGVTQNKLSNGTRYIIPLRPVNAFVLRYLLKSFSPNISQEDGRVLASHANKIPLPRVEISEQGKHVELFIPPLSIYLDDCLRLGAYQVSSGAYRLSLAKLSDLKFLAESMETDMPKLVISEDVNKLLTDPIKGFDGTLESLQSVSVGELNVVKANVQNKKARKSPKSICEKMEGMGLSTLFDLLFWLPRRYIDKSRTQDIDSLLPGEPAIVMGRIERISDMGGGMGLSFLIDTGGSQSIKAMFWRQPWLKGKFKTGQEVIISGKMENYRGVNQIVGVTIEGAQEVAMMPIVPVYKQSESKGITTAFIVSAVREMFSRLGPIELPEYLQGKDRVNYYDALKEIHLPTSLKNHKHMVNSLAYYELVQMQLIIQEQKELSRKRPGIPQPKTSRNLQQTAIESLPFSLTNAQSKALDALNAKLGDVVPSSTLVNADVGSGKTIIAQLSCLRAVEAGYQAVIVGPTDVLARQLHSTFEKLLDKMRENGEDVTLAYLGGGLKAAEKKKVLAAVKSGEIDILVGTHSLMTSVEYNNLGFVAIDEQQKFGAEQRSMLLNSRSDGRVPDLLMQTATPIPRSVAQVFYGDVDMILLDQKPPGRLPIVTEWVQEDPNHILEQPDHQLWSDIATEARSGNQTFVITPLVIDSPAIDAASVERAHETLSKLVMPNLRVGIVHGKMKTDDQKEVMQGFRNKEFDVLVASTVVEVGVDIPDATRVIVLSAERLGASSLHQIRGRVGRNSKPSKCYLVSKGKSENSQVRLRSLVESQDGFEVAKADLAIRGEGTLFSSNQSGASDAVFLSLSRHGHWVSRAAEEARDILSGSLREDALKASKDKFAVEGRLV